MSPPFDEPASPNQTAGAMTGSEHLYGAGPRKDKRGVDLISDVASRSQRSPLEQRGATPFFQCIDSRYDATGNVHHCDGFATRGGFVPVLFSTRQ